VCGGGSTVDGYAPSYCDATLTASFKAAATGCDDCTTPAPADYTCTGKTSCCPACHSVDEQGPDAFCRFPYPGDTNFDSTSTVTGIIQRLARITHAWFAMRKIRMPKAKESSSCASVTGYEARKTGSCVKTSYWTSGNVDSDDAVEDCVSALTSTACDTHANANANAGVAAACKWVGEDDDGMISCYSTVDRGNALMPPKNDISTYWGYLFKTEAACANAGTTTTCSTHTTKSNCEATECLWSHWFPLTNTRWGQARPTFFEHSFTRNSFHLRMRELYVLAVKLGHGQKLHNADPEARADVSAGGSRSTDADQCASSSCSSTSPIAKLGCLGWRYFVKPDCLLKHLDGMGTKTTEADTNVDACAQTSFRFLQSRLYCAMKILNAIAQTDPGCHRKQNSNAADWDDFEANRYNCLCRRRTKYNIVAANPSQNLGWSATNPPVRSAENCVLSNNKLPGCDFLPIGEASLLGALCAEQAYGQDNEACEGYEARSSVSGVPIR